MTLVIGPFSQILTMDQIPSSGPISDRQLPIVKDSYISVSNGAIQAIGDSSLAQDPSVELCSLGRPMVLLPGFIDVHTHICFAGSRARDYALRLEGVSYQEIAAQGGGILDTVRKTRATPETNLVDGIVHRSREALKWGVCTCEVKSGYGLSVEDELKILRSIAEAKKHSPINLIPTCLAAHMPGPEFVSAESYLEEMLEKLLPLVKKEKLANRVDIFVEEGAFSVEQARPYLLKAKEMGFKLTIHADQFSRGASLLAAEVGALSADHLEQSNEEDFLALKEAGVIPVALPGASLGLGMPFSKARLALDLGLPLVIASDWNPGSAPMGDLLTQAALFGAAEKLSCAETLAAITERAARALGSKHRGVLREGMRADFIAFPCDDYREILYQQGRLRPSRAWIAGKEIKGIL
ncbi:MAG: imidazolonepropionase [Waddliaceae bacterium]|nr:imidazolonepropionase [Waddliaceae bacterium]